MPALGPQNVKWPVLDSQHNALLCWLSPYAYREVWWNWWNWIPLGAKPHPKGKSAIHCALCSKNIAEARPYTRDQQLLGILDEHADRHVAPLDRQKVAAAEALYSLRAGPAHRRGSVLIDTETWDLIGMEIWGASREALALEARL